jgi:hypothetical protein
MTAFSRGSGTTALALALALGAGEASAAGLNLAGSFGEGGFARYVPPVTMPTLNETPFITTEVKPIYMYHKIPNDFLTDGGTVNVVALQARLAITDRLGFIATTDGYTWIDFDEGLSNTDGWNDITAGLKYAVVSDPAGGTIVTLGARYTLPVGTLETDGLDLNGTGDGYVDVFASAAQLFDKTQVQGSLGAQIAISDDNWSYIHGHLHVDHEIFPGVYPLLEANLIAPIDGGDVLPNTSLTGAEIVDIGASDPDDILTLAAGLRARASENIIFGAAFEKNVLSSNIKFLGADQPGTDSSVWDWRITTDVTIHF